LIFAIFNALAPMDGQLVFIHRSIRPAFSAADLADVYDFFYVS